MPVYDTVYTEVNDAYTFQKETYFVSTAIFLYIHFCVFGGVDTCTIYNKCVVVDFILFLTETNCIHVSGTNSGNTML
jgi:hypothetical protein